MIDLTKYETQKKLKASELLRKSCIWYYYISRSYQVNMKGKQNFVIDHLGGGYFDPRVELG